MSAGIARGASEDTAPLLTSLRNLVEFGDRGLSLSDSGRQGDLLWDLAERLSWSFEEIAARACVIAANVEIKMRPAEDASIPGTFRDSRRHRDETARRAMEHQLCAATVARAIAEAESLAESLSSIDPELTILAIAAGAASLDRLFARSDGHGRDDGSSGLASLRGLAESSWCDESELRDLAEKLDSLGEERTAQALLEAASSMTSGRP